MIEIKLKVYVMTNHIIESFTVPKNKSKLSVASFLQKLIVNIHKKCSFYLNLYANFGAFLKI